MRATLSFRPGTLQRLLHRQTPAWRLAVLPVALMAALALHSPASVFADGPGLGSVVDNVVADVPAAVDTVEQTVEQAAAPDDASNTAEQTTGTVDTVATAATDAAEPVTTAVNQTESTVSSTVDTTTTTVETAVSQTVDETKAAPSQVVGIAQDLIERTAPSSPVSINPPLAPVDLPPVSTPIQTTDTVSAADAAQPFTGTDTVAPTQAPAAQSSVTATFTDDESLSMSYIDTTAFAASTSLPTQPAISLEAAVATASAPASVTVSSLSGADFTFLPQADAIEPASQASDPSNHGSPLQMPSTPVSSESPAHSVGSLLAATLPVSILLASAWLLLAGSSFLSLRSQRIPLFTPPR